MPNPGFETLLTIRTNCKSESDNVGQLFLTDAEWNALINKYYFELYGKIVTAFGNDYFVQTPSSGYTFTTDGTNDHFALPDGSGQSPGFFKLLGVDLRLTTQNQYVSLRPFAMSERNRYSLFNAGIPVAGQTIRVLYVPRPALLVGDTDLVDGVNGWTDFIVASATMVALAKEEADVSVQMARLAAIERRLASEIEARDVSGGDRVADTMGRRGLGMAYRLNGNNLWLIGGQTPGWYPWGDWGGIDDPMGGW